MFNQQEGVDRVKFNLNRTQAYTDDQRKFPLQIADVSADTKGSITVWFDPPVPPGEKVVIGLRPYRNPSSSGIYLFGVTAFPHGDQAHGQFLGYGRLHFYDRFRRPFH